MTSANVHHLPSSRTSKLKKHTQKGHTKVKESHSIESQARKKDPISSFLAAPNTPCHSPMLHTYALPFPAIDYYFISGSSWIWLVAPDASSHITGTGSKAATAWAGCDADNAVLVTLQHELSIAGSWIPELNTAILGAGKNPVSIGSEGNREHEILIIVSWGTRSDQYNIPCGLRMS